MRNEILISFHFDQKNLRQIFIYTGNILLVNVVWRYVVHAICFIRNYSPQPTAHGAPWAVKRSLKDRLSVVPVTIQKTVEKIQFWAFYLTFSIIPIIPIIPRDPESPIPNPDISNPDIGIAITTGNGIYCRMSLFCIYSYHTSPCNGFQFYLTTYNRSKWVVFSVKRFEAWSKKDPLLYIV